MKTFKNNSSKVLITTFAIALSAISIQSAQAESEKAHEIGWSSRLSSMGLNEVDNLNKQFTFHCQPAIDDLIHAPIWGTDFYTTNSGICSTAVHRGMIRAEDGGKVTIKILEGKTFYTGSYKNKVTSQDHRTTDISFTFVGQQLIEKVRQENKSQAGQSSGIEKVMVNGVQRGIERSIEKAITEIFK